MPNFSFYIPEGDSKAELLNYVRFLGEQKLLSEIVTRALESTKMEVIQEIIVKLEAELEAVRKFSEHNREVYAVVMAERIGEREDALRDLTVLWDRYVSGAKELTDRAKIGWVKAHRDQVRAIGDSPEVILGILEGR